MRSRFSKNGTRTVFCEHFYAQLLQLLHTHHHLSFGCLFVSYKDSDELEDCINMAILTLKEAFEGEMDEKNIGISISPFDMSVLVVSYSFVSHGRTSTTLLNSKPFLILFSPRKLIFVCRTCCRV